jgi:hypothetical protein
MDINNIEDVLNLSAVLAANGAAEAAHQPYTIAALIDWADSRTDDAPIRSSAKLDRVVATVEDKPKAKRGKATEPDDSVPGDGFTATPDPSEPDF